MKNMLRYLSLLLTGLSLLVVSVQAQSKEKANLPVTTPDTVNTLPIREYLVQLAMQNPDLEIADSRIAIAEYELKKAKTKALNNIAISGNLNEFTVKGSNAGTNQFFPRYNIGATLPLDLFFTRSNEIKIAKENIHITQAEKNARYREIRSMVLIAYEDYLMHKEMLEFQSQITQDAYTSFLKSEKDFSDAIIPQEEYNKAFKSYSDEQTKKITLGRNLSVSKLELERMIGKPLDEVLFQYRK
jgi:outer membrane protein TolC